MALLNLQASGKSYLWGGTRLVEHFGKQALGEQLAETWELSCHPDGECYITNGECAGITLSEYIKRNPSATGKNCERFDQFPLLIKLIDAQKSLSVQVHPDDEYAKANEGQLGKTEMWYIVDCEEGASIYWGPKRSISRQELSESIENNTHTELLNEVPVKKNDCFFIEAGTIHAIGAGIVVAEVQQSSNVTYRVYDYGRVGADGKQRELHVDKALAVANLAPVQERSFDGHLASCEYFTVDKLDVDGSYTAIADDSSFHSILVLEGSGTVSCCGEEISFTKGSSIMITAGSGKYTVNGKCEAILTTV